MNWFYLSESQEVGPLSVAALEEIHANGCITDETPVRREDSTEWEAYSTVFSSQCETHQNPAPPCDRPFYKFHCLHCQQSISAEEDCSGKTVQCPTCGADFIVPYTDKTATSYSGKISRKDLPSPNAEIKSSDSKLKMLSKKGKGAKSRKIALAAVGILLVTGAIFMILSHFRKILEDITNSESVEYILPEGAADFNLKNIKKIEIVPGVITASGIEVTGSPIDVWYAPK